MLLSTRPAYLCGGALVLCLVLAVALGCAGCGAYSRGLANGLMGVLYTGLASHHCIVGAVFTKWPVSGEKPLQGLVVHDGCPIAHNIDIDIEI